MDATPARGARAVPIALALLVVASGLRPIDDFDVWYHLAAGRLMWSTGTWPATNTFGFTAPDHPWIDLHWLFQIVLYGAYTLAGPTGAVLLATALLLATAAVLYVLARRFVPAAAAALLLATAFAIASPRFVPRPELVSFVLLAAYLWILDGHPRNGRAIYWLIPLQIVWTNSQGIFAIGLGLIGCYWLGATLALLPLPRGWREESGCSPREWTRLTLVLLLSTAACFVNPYGLTGVLFPLELLPRVTASTIFSTRIGEFRGPFESGYAPPLAYAWLGLMVLTAVSFLLNLRRVHLGRLFAAIAFGYLSSQTLRNMALFAWIAVPVSAANLGAVFGGGARSTRSRPAPFARVALVRRFTGVRWRVAANLATVAILLVLTTTIVTNWFAWALRMEQSFGVGVSRLRFSDEAIQFTRDVGIGGRPFNDLATGGFLAWERFPESYVFVDGRLEAYPESVFREYFRVMDDPVSWNKVAAQYRPDYVILMHIWPNRLGLVRFLAAGHDWTLVYYDESMSIFLPTDQAHRDLVDRAQRRFTEILLRRQREPKPPRPWWRDLVVANEDFWRHRSHGQFLRTIGQWDAAGAAYAEALAIDPDDSEIRFNLGLAYWNGGKPSQAEREWRDVLRRDPTYKAAERALAGAASARAARPPS